MKSNHKSKSESSEEPGHFGIKEVMNVREVADYLGYSERTVYKLIKEEGLPAINIRGQFRFKKDIVDMWLKDRMTTK